MFVNANQGVNHVPKNPFVDFSKGDAVALFIIIFTEYII